MVGGNGARQHGAAALEEQYKKDNAENDNRKAGHHCRNFTAVCHCHYAKNQACNNCKDTKQDEDGAGGLTVVGIYILCFGNRHFLAELTLLTALSACAFVNHTLVGYDQLFVGIGSRESFLGMHAGIVVGADDRFALG